MKTAEAKAPAQQHRHHRQNFFGEQGHDGAQAELEMSNESFFAPRVGNGFNEDSGIANTPPGIQTKLQVGQPGDRYEKEADFFAERVVNRVNEGAHVEATSGTGIQKKPAFITRTEGHEVQTSLAPHLHQTQPLIQTVQEEDQSRDAEEEEDGGTSTEEKVRSTADEPSQAHGETIQRSANNDSTQDISTQLSQSKNGGQAMDSATREDMETGFGTDFSGVRIHTDANAVQMSQQLGAQAFTYGSDVYFNEGKYNPGSSDGKHLLAHELTHTMQQGAVARPKELEVSPTTPKVQGIFGAIWRGVKRVGRAIGSAISKGWEWVKGKIKDGLNWAAERLIPGYSLLNVVLGKNIITDQPVERSGVNLIRGYMRLSPIIGSILLNELEETKSLREAGVWVEEQVARFGINFDLIAANLRAFWKKASVIRGIDYNVGLFRRYIGPFIGKFMRFSGVVMQKVKELRFEAALRLVGATKLLEAVKKNPAAFKRIVDDPKIILKNFMKALKQGFNQFKTNFFTHFKNALFGWLFGKAAEMGVNIPKKFDVPSLFQFVAELVGATKEQIRAQIVKQLGPKGEAIVSALESSVTLFKDLITRGPIALWEKVMDQLANLKQMIFGEVTKLVIAEIIKVAVIKLVSMLNPAGAIVQLVLTLFRVIKFFIDWWDTIKQIAMGVISSITNVALGQIKGAANFIERLFATGMKLVIAFLAGIFGLGGIVSKVKKLIQKIAGPVQKAIKKVIKFLVKKFRSLLKKGKAKVKGVLAKIFEWWKVKKTFKAKDGSSHKIYYKGKSENAKLMVASFKPDTVRGKIAEKKKEFKDLKGAAKTTFDNAVKKVNEQLPKIETNQKELRKHNGILKRTKDPGKIKDRKKLIKKEAGILKGRINALTSHLYNIMTGVGEKPYPDVKYPRFTNSGIAPKNSVVKFLSKKKQQKGTKSGAHSGNLHGWNVITANKLQLGQGGTYVKMHLISEQMGGLAVNTNLTPAPQWANSNFYERVERPAITAMNHGDLIWYDVKINYGHVVEEKKFINRLDAKYGAYDFDEKANPPWKENAKVLGKYGTNIPAPKITPVVVNINTETNRTKIHEALKISKALAGRIIAYRLEKKANNPNFKFSKFTFEATVKKEFKPKNQLVLNIREAIVKNRVNF